MGGLALWLGGLRQISAWILLVVAWALFMAVLYATSGLLGPEMAGVSAGLTVLCVGLLSARRRGPLRAWPSKAWPYWGLLLAIASIKLVLLVTDLGATIVVTGRAVSWQPLASPGLALAIVLVAILVRGRGTDIARNLGGDWVRRSWKPLATIFFFLLMSQALLKGGFLEGFQAGLAQLYSSTLGPVAAALAGLSGYLTGSNVGGNAIFMPTLAHLPVAEAEWLAAIQNSGAGHGALGSLSILALITGLAKADRAEEQRLFRFGFAVVLTNTVLVAAMGSVLIAWLGN
jgi:lactate permease